MAVKNRHIPFGYRIKHGEYVQNDAEAATVRAVFASYLAGDGYTTITRALNFGIVPYSDGAAWNKHMVKRILENRRYIGDDRYPAIIVAEVFDAANALRASKPSATQTRKPPPERNYDCEILPYRPNAAVLKLSNTINRALERAPDPQQIRPLVFALAAEKYAAIEVRFADENNEMEEISNG